MKERVIFAWGVPSDHGSAIYEVILRADGAMECPCPGWVFKRNGQPRTCKHVKRLASKAADILLAFTDGKPLPAVSVLDDTNILKRLVRPAEQRSTRAIIKLED